MTFIAFYHYVRIFNSWVDSYAFPASDGGAEADPMLTGKPFDDAYRYMDWLLTVPLLLSELVLVMDMSEQEKQRQSAVLGFFAAMMIAVGYPGEMITEGPYGTRWMCWAIGMAFFAYIVHTLLKGLEEAHLKEVANDDAMAGGRTEKVAPLIHLAKLMTVISWCTYPLVYIFPMIGMEGSQAVVGVQIGYCISDIISKCGVGMLIYRICVAKSGARPLSQQAAGSGDKEAAVEADATERLPHPTTHRPALSHSQAQLSLPSSRLSCSAIAPPCTACHARCCARQYS